ncbi:MAG: glycosyltransferase family 2 protein [Thermoprotei archaeon]
MRIRPLASVIVAAYNRRSFLLNALRSLSNQTFKDFEVIVVKNFYDKEINDYIHHQGFKDIFIDTKYYGEQIAVVIEEAKGDIILFLEDDDEYEQNKLHVVTNIFHKIKGVSYVHDSRSYIDEYGHEITYNNPKYLNIVKSLESITPSKDVIIDPNNQDHIKYLLRYYGIVSTVSMMAVKTDCIRKKHVSALKRIQISVEAFIPAVAIQCGYLYHTAHKLTKYRIHKINSSIAFNEVDKLRRYLFNLRRAINDHELIINEVLKLENLYVQVVRLQQLQAKYILAKSRYKHIFNDVIMKPNEVFELCKLVESGLNTISPRTILCYFRRNLSIIMNSLKSILSN